MTRLSTLVNDTLPEDGNVISMDQDLLDALLDRTIGAALIDTEKPFYTEACIHAFGGRSDELYARSGGWVFHLKRSVAQSALSGVLMAIVLKSVTATPLSLILIPSLLPYLFQIEKTEITMKDEELLLHLLSRGDVHALSVDEIYDRLPEKIRDGVNRLDIIDFLESIIATGHAQETQRGLFTLRHPDNPRLVVKIK